MTKVSLTPFGVALRVIRAGKSLRQKDVAQKLDCSIAFISAIELGAKEIPDDFVSGLTKEFGLTQEERGTLESAEIVSRKRFVIYAETRLHRELAGRLATCISDLTPEQAKEIMKILQSAGF